MTRELIINGQHVDLPDSVSITLEYVSSAISDIGKLSFAHSYTIKLPKTRRNAAILDNPDNLGRDTASQHIMDAAYYRNGINLIGSAQARLLKVTPDAYEVMLLWNSVPGLTEWSATRPNLSALPGLPVIEWVGARIADKHTTDGCFVARYDSGLRGYETTVAIHPSVTLYELLTQIFDTAGAPYSIGANLATILKNHALLVAPSHKPNLEMELESGARASRFEWVTTSGSGSKWMFQGWTLGWDAPKTLGSLETGFYVYKSTYSRMRIFLNMKISGGDADIYFDLGNDFYLAPSKTADGGFLIDQNVDLVKDLGLSNEYDTFGLTLRGTLPQNPVISAYDPSKPLFALILPHDTIQTQHQNLFPIAENMPEIDQVSFLKSVLGMFGAVILAHDGKVVLERMADLYSKSTALDWSDKVDMIKGGAEDITRSLDGFAKKNFIKYEEDVSLPVSPDFVLTVDDPNAPEQRDMLKLPFAASHRDIARHYQYTNPGTNVIQDINIKPRIFGFVYDSDGSRRLFFPDELLGKSGATTYLQRYQDIIRKPIKISANIRLSELDLAQLDLRRAIYLSQYGHYYAILKLQTSATDLCKVELLQLP